MKQSKRETVNEILISENKEKEQQDYKKLAEEFKDPLMVEQTHSDANDVITHSDNAELMQEKQAKSIKRVNSLMPAGMSNKMKKSNAYAHQQMHQDMQINEELLDQKQQQEGLQDGQGAGYESFPESLKNAITALSKWGKTKAESSGPVKEAAKRLTEAKDEKSAAESLGRLFLAAIKYLDLRADQWHLWFGDGRKRLKQIREFVDQAYLYSADTSAVFGETMQEQMDSLNQESFEKPERYQRHVRNAEYLRDLKNISNKGEVSDTHIRPEKKLTKKHFEKIYDILGDLNNLGLMDDILMSTDEEAIANKEANTVKLLELKEMTRDYQRGLAMGYEVEYSRAVYAEIAISIIDKLIAEIDKGHDMQALVDAKIAEYNATENKRFDQMDESYSIANSFPLAKYEDDAQKIFTNNHYIEAYKNDPKNKEKIDKFKKSERYSLDYLITRDILNRMSNEGNPEYFSKGLLIKEAERKDYYVRMLRRRAQGNLMKEVAGVGTKVAEGYKAKIEEAVSKNDYEVIAQMAESIINTDIEKLRTGMYENPGLTISRLTKIKMMKAYIPYITVNAKKCGLDPNGIAKLTVCCDMADYIETEHSLAIRHYAKGEVYMDEAQLEDEASKSRIHRYASHIKKNQDPLIKAEGEKLESLYDDYNAKSMLKDPDETYRKSMLNTENNMILNSVNEVETLGRFIEDEKSYTPEQFDEKLKSRVETIDKALNICRTFLKKQKKTDSQSARIDGIQEYIEQLKAQKKHLTKNMTYEKGIAEVFDKESEHVWNVLKGISLDYSTKYDGSDLITRERYDEKMHLATGSLSELLEKCNSQLDCLGEGEKYAELKTRLTQHRDKTSSRLEKLRATSYEDYMKLYEVYFVTDMLNLSESDEKRGKMITDETMAFEAKVTEYSNYMDSIQEKNRVKKDEIPGEKPAEKTGIELEKEVNAYFKKREESSNIAKEYSDFKNSVKAKLDSLSDEELENADDVVELVLGKETSMEDIMDKILSAPYADITMEDVDITKSASGLTVLPAAQGVMLGGDDIGPVGLYCIKFFDDPKFAQRMGLKEEHKEDFEKLKRSVCELQILSTKYNLFSHILLKKPFQIPTGMSEIKDKAAKQINERFNSIYSKRNTCFIKLMETKFEKLCTEYTSFLLDNDIKMLIEKEPGVEVDYNERFEKFESMIDTKGMDQQQIYKAKYEFLDKGFKEKMDNVEKMNDEDKAKVNGVRGYPFEAGFAAFTGMMRRMYYKKKIK